MMRRILAVFLLLLVLPAWAQSTNTVNVSYTWTDFLLAPQSVRKATLTPLVPFADFNGAILSAVPRSLVTGTNGSVTFSNVVSGYSYQIQLDTPYGSTVRTDGFPTSLTGNVNGRDYLGTIQGMNFFYLYPTNLSIYTSGISNTLYAALQPLFSNAITNGSTNAYVYTPVLHSQGSQAYSEILTNDSLGLWAGINIGLGFPWAGGPAIPFFNLNSNGATLGFQGSYFQATSTNGFVGIQLANLPNGTVTNTSTTTLNLLESTTTGHLYGQKYPSAPLRMAISMDTTNGIRIDDGIGDALTVISNRIFMTDIGNDTFKLDSGALTGPATVYSNGIAEMQDGNGDILVLKTNSLTLIGNAGPAYYIGNARLLTNDSGKGPLFNSSAGDGSQLTNGTGNRFASTNEGSAVTFTNPANQFSGSGAGLTGVTAQALNNQLVGTGLGSIVFDPYIGGPSYGFSFFTQAKYATNEMNEMGFYTAKAYNLVYPRLVYCNVQTNQIQSSAGLSSDEKFTNQVTTTISASIQWPPGRWVKARFNGQNYVTVSSNCIVVSDPLPIEIPSNSVFKVRTFTSSPKIGFAVERDPTSTGAWGLFPVGATSWGTNDITDLTMGGTINGNVNWGNTPIVTGTLQGPKKPVALGLIGDSLMGVSAMPGGSPTSGDDGFWESLVSNSIPFLRSTCVGALARDALTNEVQMSTIGNYCTHVLMQYSVNDRFNGFTALSNACLATWTFYAQRGIKVYQTTMTPQTTSSDNWATTNNQSLDGNYQVRTNFNTWVRSVPAPLSGILDLGAICETATNSCIWRVNGTALWATTDGTHWNTNMIVQMYPTVSNFVWQISQ